MNYAHSFYQSDDGKCAQTTTKQPGKKKFNSTCLQATNFAGKTSALDGCLASSGPQSSILQLAELSKSLQKYSLRLCANDKFETTYRSTPAQHKKYVCVRLFFKLNWIS